MLTLSDQLGRIITIPDHPKRIVSIVPSQTELLSDLGLNEQVVGITKFCVRPQNWFHSKSRVGGTKNLNLAKIDALEPEIIFANKEENTKDQIETLDERYPVWISDVSDLVSALDMIRSIANITDSRERGSTMIGEIEERFENLRRQTGTGLKGVKVAYLIWNDPYMAAGGDTFIHSMLTSCGFENVFGDRDRYPQISIDDIRNSDCELVLLSSEPFPFREQHREELKAQLPNTKIVLVDGQMFSWYGSRLLHAPAYFKKLLLRIEREG